MPQSRRVHREKPIKAQRSLCLCGRFCDHSTLSIIHVTLHCFRHLDSAARFLGFMGCQGETQGLDSIVQGADRFGLPARDCDKMTRLRDEKLVPLEAFGRWFAFYATNPYSAATFGAMASILVTLVVSRRSQGLPPEHLAQLVDARLRGVATVLERSPPRPE